MVIQKMRNAVIQRRLDTWLGASTTQLRRVVVQTAAESSAGRRSHAYARASRKYTPFYPALSSPTIGPHAGRMPFWEGLQELTLAQYAQI